MPAVDMIDLGIEQHRVDALALEVEPREVRFDARREPRRLRPDRSPGHHLAGGDLVGTRRAAEHRIAVREAAEARDDVVVLAWRSRAARSSPSSVNSSNDAVLVVEILAVLERHVEEPRSRGSSSSSKPLVDRRLGDRQREVIGRELVGVTAEHVARELVEQDHRRERGQRIGEEASTGSWRFSVHSLRNSLADLDGRAPARRSTIASGSSPNQNLRTSARQSPRLKPPCLRPSGPRSAGSAGRPPRERSARPCRTRRCLRRARGRCRCP